MRSSACAPARPLHPRPLHPRPRSFACRALRAAPATASPAPFPSDYAELTTAAGASVRAAVADGVRLIEGALVSFPAGGLESVSGDVEGNVETDLTCRYTAQLLRGSFPSAASLAAVRLLFPDPSEERLAGAPGAPLAALSCPRTWLCGGGLGTTTGLSRLGLFGSAPELRALSRAAPTDAAWVALYPGHNLDELVALSELADDAEAAGLGTTPIVVVNGELDRIRSGYYPAFWAFREMSILRAFVPRFEPVFYLHNFKGSSPCVLYRAYPGPFQVLSRTPDGGLVTLATLDVFPGLQAVARDIIPAALAARRAKG